MRSSRRSARSAGSATDGLTGVREPVGCSRAGSRPSAPCPGRGEIPSCVPCRCVRFRELDPSGPTPSRDYRRPVEATTSAACRASGTGECNKWDPIEARAVNRRADRRRNPFEPPMQMSRKLFVCLTLSLLALVVAAPAAGAGLQVVEETSGSQGTGAHARPDRAHRGASSRRPQPTLRAQKRALDKLEDELSKMIHDAQGRRGASSSSSSAGSKPPARTSSKTRTMMLVPHAPHPDRRAEHQAAPAVRASDEEERRGKGHGQQIALDPFSPEQRT